MELKIKNIIGSKYQSILTRNCQSGAGFTLIELLIVVAIIGILSTLLMTNFVGIRQRARDAQRKSDLRQIQSALELYRSDNGSYPLTANFPACPSSFPASGSPTYMQKIPCDPIKTGQYVYTYISAAGSTYSLISCLENTSDSQKDTANNGSYCTGGTTNWSYTLQNP